MCRRAFVKPWERSSSGQEYAWRKRKMGKKQSGDGSGGARLNGEVVLMDWDYKEKLEMEEHVLEPKRVVKHG